LLLLQLLFLLLPLLLNLLFKCLLHLLLFLKVLFLFFRPDLFVKYLLVFYDFTPFVRWDLAWNICCLLPSFNLKLALVSSLSSFQSLSCTSKTIIWNYSCRPLLLQLCDWLQVHHTFPNIEFFLQTSFISIPINILLFDWLQKWGRFLFFQCP
jgi:hypothetical protein